jgi:hypothetical protein
MAEQLSRTKRLLKMQNDAVWLARCARKMANCFSK